MIGSWGFVHESGDLEESEQQGLSPKAKLPIQR